VRNGTCHIQKHVQLVFLGQNEDPVLSSLALLNETKSELEQRLDDHQKSVDQYAEQIAVRKSSMSQIGIRVANCLVEEDIKRLKDDQGAQMVLAAKCKEEITNLQVQLEELSEKCGNAYLHMSQSERLERLQNQGHFLIEDLPQYTRWATREEVFSPRNLLCFLLLSEN
jgi:predicted DNA binding CopG/RHH family protein